MALEFDLGETLDFVARHKRDHPKPVARCPYCVPNLKAQVKADLEKQLGRVPTRREVDADPRCIAADAQTQFDLMRFARAFGVQPKP
jgi:hypothetical protein